MSSAKKGAKGNKTAHVLNLLTAPGEAAAPVEETAEEAVQETTQPASGRPLLPPILEVAQTNDNDLSQQIQQALEDELLQELAPESVPEVKEPPAPVEDKPAPATPAAAPEPEPAPPAENPDPVQAQPVQSSEDDITYINVMQTLVEEKAPQYIKKFGLCTCKQCLADVEALTLTNLVPKYVVLSKLDRIPMLTVYEGRYNTTIFAQLTRACKTVMDHPHHNREK